MRVESGKSIDPPLRTVAAFDRLVATIQDHDDSELELKCIASREGAIEHVDAVVIRQFL